MRVGIIRCQQTEDMCPGTVDFRVARLGKLAFEETGPAEIIGFMSCGGCPGKKAVSRAAMMVERGAKAIFLTSCISKGTPIGFPCPHFEAMKKALKQQLGDEVKLITWTH